MRLGAYVCPQILQELECHENSMKKKTDSPLYLLQSQIRPRQDTIMYVKYMIHGKLSDSYSSCNYHPDSELSAV